jgi:phosphatidylserine decarboxylase
VWAGAVAPASRRVATWHYGEQLAKPIELARGQEMGRFNMGSTVILLYGPEQMDWLDTLQAGTELRMGAQIGRYHATE